MKSFVSPDVQGAEEIYVSLTTVTIKGSTLSQDPHAYDFIPGDSDSAYSGVKSHEEKSSHRNSNAYRLHIINRGKKRLGELKNLDKVTKLVILGC